MTAIRAARVELERLYSQRVDDDKVDAAENSAYKESCMKALRDSESCFTSYNGSVRSIKSVLETLLNISIAYYYADIQ